MQAFRAPKTALGDIDAEAAAALIAAAADIALILDESGTIRDVSIATQDLMDDLAGQANWLNKAWTATVTEDSRPKVEALIAAAASGQEPRWRHLNHPAASGADVPVLYAVVRTGTPGRIVAFGRDLRAVSSLQRRLIDAQQSMERDYARIRYVETRYRLLFQTASDAVLIVDDAARRVLDSNPTARRLFADAAEPNRPWPLTNAFTAETARSVELLLAGVRASGRTDDVRARLLDGDHEVTVTASLFRDESGVACLLRITQPGSAPAAELPKLKAKLLKLMESAPDGFVVIGADGRVVTANTTFLELAQLPTEDQARGEPLTRWLGRSEVDLDILITNLRQHGSVRLFSSLIRGELGESANVEISAVTVMNGGQHCFGFAIRDVGRRLQHEPRIEQSLPRSLENVTALIGRVALKDLVREATDVIERLCIETALNLTGDNRASAAEMLGLSRQSLYVKLRRYGLGDPAAAGAGLKENSMDTATAVIAIDPPAAPRPSMPVMLELLKPITWFAPMWAFGCGVVSSGVPILDRWWALILGVILAGPMVCGTSQAVNDWFDRHVDAINEPNRPIPSGRLPGRSGLFIAIAWTMVSLLVAAPLGAWGFGAAVVGLTLAWAYSAPPLRLKRNGWWGNTACAACYEGLPWITGAAVMTTTSPGWQILTVAALYSAGAHGIMTLNDFKSIEGDRQTGILSLPVLLGVEGAANAACIAMAIPQLVVVALLLAWGFVSFAFVVALLLMAQLLLMVRLMRDPGGNAPWYNATGTTLYVIGMLITAFALRMTP